MKLNLNIKQLITNLCLAVVALVSENTSQAETFRLETATIEDIDQAMDAGALMSEQLVKMCLKRISAYEKQGPTINTVITLQPRALEMIRALDQERKVSGPRSKLLGIPVILKDLYDTYDMPVSGGFLPLKDSQPWRDGFVVKKFRDDGSIILAKVNTLDWFSKQLWWILDGVSPQIKN